RELSLTYNILAVIGDRPEDVIAANRNYLTVVLFKSTMTDCEINELSKEYGANLIICTSWPEIYMMIERLESGKLKMEDLRLAFTDQYAKWLGDIDNKCRIVATISAALSALLGKVVFDMFSTCSGSAEKAITGVLSLALLCSVLSMLYSIRAFTSRHTSGKEGGITVKTRVKQWVAILLGWPEKWSYISDDAVDYCKKLKQGNEAQRSKAHLRFFFDMYKTYDPDALSNLRLFELRAANYAKLYAERIASSLLGFSIVITIFWFVLKMIILFN
ncbi:MAG: hypothetical protein ACLP29_04530, partial [Dissulfurispiraceae bacterium]